MMNKMIDTSHLNSLYIMLSHERERLTKAKTESEREIRKVWVAGIEKEILQEKKFLGIESVEEFNALSDDDLLSELLG